MSGGTRRGPTSTYREILESEYKLESESNTGSTLFDNQLLSPTPLPYTPSSLLSTLPLPYIISQHSINYELVAQQQQEQLAALQAQLQVLQERLEMRGVAVGVSTEVARLQVFDRILSKVSGFVIACKLYIRMKIRGAVVEEQIQWVLSYVQEGSADVWKENMLENLEGELLEYETVGEFLADIRKEFGEGDEELVKVAELKRLEQGEKTMEKFV